MSSQSPTTPLNGISGESRPGDESRDLPVRSGETTLESVPLPATVAHAPAEFLHLYSSIEGHVLDIEKPSALAFNALAEDGLRQERPFVLGVTSAVQGEGKTTTAMYLALTMAMNSYKRICLLDLSLSENSFNDLGERMGLYDAGDGGPRQITVPGVVDVLEETSQTVPTFQMADPDNLIVIPRGRSASRPARISRSPRIGQILSSARHAFDVIIVDLPAIATENALPLSRHMDGVLMVVQAGATPREIVQRGVDVIGREKIVGLALNRQKSHVPAWLSRMLRL